MLLYHVNLNIIFLFFCFFFIKINANLNIIRENKKYTKKYRNNVNLKWLKYNYNKLEKEKYKNKLYFFLKNNIYNKILHKYNKKKKYILYKKNKKKDKQPDIKTKEKRKFTEEEIEELRRKAKEKEEKKRKPSKKKIFGKKKKVTKAKKKKEKIIKKETKDEEIVETEEIQDDIIKTKEDFDKIVSLSDALINPKEVEYIKKISDCDEQLLNYDKREKVIQLNYEDTIFDEGNYMDNYINNISKFRFDIYNINNKNEFDRITKYLNYHYIEEIKVDEPKDKNYNIELKEYFYDVVCKLIDDYKDKFENYIINENEIKHDEYKKDDEYDKFLNDNYKDNKKEEITKIEMYKGFTNLNNELNSEKNILTNFVNENNKINEKYTTLHKIEETVENYLKKKNDMTKYMTIELYTLLKEIKDEYNYMFTNGGLKFFSFDQTRKKNKEKLIFTGKKKRAFAKVFLQPGNNHLIINNRDGYQYLQYQILNLNKIFSPLLHLCMNRKFNVIANVSGGGLSGQSVAIFHALVKYIVYNFSLKIKPYFRSFNFMTIDSRKVERKKYGYRKARKKKQYSKR